MPSRRKRRVKLSQSETAEFMEAATRLHRACCRPLLSTMSDDHRVLSDLNEAICEAIVKVTGKEPPWMTSMSVYKPEAN